MSDVFVPYKNYDHIKKRLKYHSKQIRALGIKNDDVIMDRVVELLARDFVVSREVILRRIDKDAKNT